MQTVTYRFIDKKRHLCVLGLIIILLIGGCVSQPAPETGLYGKATHTGTLYIYRVPPIAIDTDIAPRFSQLRGSMDLDEFIDNDGAIRPELHVTEEDLITVSLGSAFIKYFREGSINKDADGDDKRKGEIVMVMSFDAGTAKRESFVVFSSGEQTLGSFLSVQDWPVLGPLKVDGSDLKIRIVLIELDQAENEKIKQLTRSVGNTAGQLQPSLTPIVKIAQPLIDAIIALNSDDVILDQRFALHRVEKASKRNEIHRAPLLFGEYVLIMQEDRLKGNDVKETAGGAVNPPALSNIRFDRHTHRLYKVYDYWTDQWGWSFDEQEQPSSELPSANNPNAPGPKIVDLEAVYDLGGCPSEENFNYTEHPDANQVRTRILGYDNARTTGLERYNCLENALAVAYYEGLRGSSFPKKSSTNDPNIRNGATTRDYRELLNSKRKLNFDFPVTVYPTANAALAQYPLHTHIVLTIEESLGGPGVPVHEVLTSLEQFNEKELSKVKDGELADKIGETLVQAKLEDQKQTALLRKVKAEVETNEKLCLLFNELNNSDETKILSSGPLYNQVYKISGEVVSTTEELAKYLGGTDANCTDESICSCSADVSKILSKTNSDSL